MKPYLVFFGILAFLVSASNTFACVCGDSKTSVEFNSAEAVFVGKVLGGTEKLTVRDNDGKERPIEAGTVQFAVLENFKGASISRLEVQVASNVGTDCGPYGLTAGETYLVYAYARDGASALLYTGVCTRTSPIKNEWVKPDLAFLRNLPPPGSGGNIDGSIWDEHRHDGRSPFAGTLIRVVKLGKGGKEIAVRTDDKGEFHLTKLPAGTYRIEPQLPPHYVLDELGIDPALGYNFKVDDRGTAVAHFKAVIDSLVSGRLLDRDGQGINTAMLKLIHRDQPANSLGVNYAHSTGENGDFTGKDIAAGEYYLYIELQNRDYRKNRNYYYPGTFERSEATVIKLDFGGTVNGLVFTLPDEFKVRTVEGRVLLPDGKPAVGVEVGLWSASSANPDGFLVTDFTIRTTTDEHGRFRLEGQANVKYCLTADTSEDYSAPDSAHRSAPRQVLILKENLTDRVLILSEIGVFNVCLGDP